MFLDNFSLRGQQMVPDYLPYKCPDFYFRKIWPQFWANKTFDDVRHYAHLHTAELTNFSRGGIWWESDVTLKWFSVMLLVIKPEALRAWLETWMTLLHFFTGKHLIHELLLNQKLLQSLRVRGGFRNRALPWGAICQKKWFRLIL